MSCQSPSDEHAKSTDAYPPVTQALGITYTTTTTTTTTTTPGLSGTTRVSRYQKGRTRKVKPVWIYWSKRQ